MKNQIGIWLDKKEAFLIRFNNGNSNVRKLESNIENFHLELNEPAKKPFGATEAPADRKRMEREKQQIKHYLDNILEEVKDADELYIFGPAETKFKLKQSIADDKKYSLAIRKIDSSDSMTKNQMVAQAKKAFGMKPAKK